MSGRDIQVDHGGYVRIHHEILEQLAKLELSGREVRILFALLRLTYGFNRKEDAISLVQFCALTNLKKSHASVTLKHLVERRIINRKDAGTGRGHIAIYGFNKYYEQWDCAEKVTDGGNDNEPERLPASVTFNAPERLPQTARKVTPVGNRKVTPDHEHTKDSIKDISKDKQIRAQAPPPPPDHSSAVLLYHKLYHVYPDGPQCRLIDKAVTDPALWAQVLAWWAGKKYNPVKVGDMLDVYRHPERMAHRNGTHATHRSIPKNRELEAQLAQEHQQARAELETARADAEAEQAARLQQRRAMYGTQPEDVTWWAAAREEIFYATNANVHRLVRDTELLELRHDTVRIAVPDEEAQRALAHPPSLKAIERTLSRFVNHPLTLVVEVFA